MIAFLTKGFTALAVLQLEERGLLSCNDRLSKYCPDVTDANMISLDMLLNHRSGIHCHTELPDFNTTRRTKICTLENTINTFKAAPLDFKPGSRFEYSNSNYILLGYIIESVTGREYAEFIQENIFNPLNMDRSGYEFYGQNLEGIAKGYILKDGKIVSASDRIMQNAHASGALYSTAYDMYLWCRGLDPNSVSFDNKILSKVNNPPYKEYGYGWASLPIYGKMALAHAGETEGFRPFILRFVGEEVCVIVLSNFEHCRVDRIGIDLAAIVFGEPYDMPKKSIEVDKDMLASYKSYEGRYEVKPGFDLTITRRGKNIYCQATRQSKLQLYPESNTEFFFKDVDAKVKFVKDNTGRVVKLVLHQNGREYPAVKK